MNFDDLEASLLRRREGAPSDLELDRLVCGALSPKEAAEVEARAQEDPRSAARLAELRRGMDAFPGADERRLLAGIRRGLDAEAPSRLKKALRSLYFLAPAGLVAVVAMMVLVPTDDPGDSQGGVATNRETGVRVKGGIKLEVVRKRGQKAEKVISGSSFRAGDSLRFVISLPRAGEVSVVGVEGDGSLYVAWPLRQEVSTHREAGDAQVLPGAVELDDAKGKETLHLVLCPSKVAPVCRSAGADQAPDCPDACVSTPFVILKE